MRIAVAGDEPHVGDRSALLFGRIVGNRTLGRPEFQCLFRSAGANPSWRDAFE
jgi:hypothetical protein